MALHTYEVEHTDTFGGEANYCWVKRCEVKLGEGESKLALVTRAKKAIGLTGVRCKREDFGDMIRLTPVGRAEVVFITYKEEDGHGASDSA